MPLNFIDAHYQIFAEKILPLAVGEDMGVLGMKPMGDHILLNSNTVSAVECLDYAMNLPVTW